MAKIWVQMVHEPCGHDFHHLVEQNRNNRELYEEMHKLPCPVCRGVTDYPDAFATTGTSVRVEPVTPREAALDRIEREIAKLDKKVPRHRMMRRR